MEAHRATAPVTRGFPLQAWDTARAIATSTWFLGFAVFALSWGGGIVPLQTPSIDHSFHAALQMAAHRGLNYGSDMVITYGPVGFVKSYLAYYPGSARLAVLYGVSLQLALSVSLVWVLRRNYPLAIAVALGLIVAVFARGDESGIAIRDDAAVVILAMLWCVAALSRDPAPLAGKIVAYGAGPFAAFEVLAKLNTGVIVFVLAAITLAALPGRRRNLAIFGGSFLATCAVLWFATGQALGDVWPYVRDSLEISAGYATGARLDWQVRDYDYWLGPVLLAGALILAWVATIGMARWRRIPLLALLAFVGYSAGKGGYIAHDYYHMAVFYTTVLGMVVVLWMPPDRRVRWLALAVAAAAIAGVWTTKVPGYPLTNPIENLSSGASTIWRAIDNAKMVEDIAADRAGEVADYAIDRRSLDLIGDRPVSIDPSEMAAAWAYGLNWKPLPIFQPYAAWTPSLDDRNADVLASESDGPQVILRQNLNALGRYPGWESPAAMLSMLCHFEPLHTTDTWEVLGRVPDRCGEPRPVGSVSGAWGEPIAIPAAPPGTVLYAKVHGTTDTGVRALVSTLTRPEPRQVQFDGTAPFTFITGTATDGLILRSPADADYPAPYTLAPNSDHVTFTVLGTPPDGPVELELYAMPIDPSGGP